MSAKTRSGCSLHADLEREWFRLLQTVQGVGTKVALAILSTLKASDLASAIALGDKVVVARAPGVGRRWPSASSPNEDRVPAFAGVAPDLARLQGDLGDKRAPGPISDAVSALVNLGYGQTQASAPSPRPCVKRAKAPRPPG